jgi:hypothetical protein
MNPTAGYTMTFNIEADPREVRNVAQESAWLAAPYVQAIGPNGATLEDHPNAPAPNVVDF